jgi:hypothetical protein
MANNGTVTPPVCFDALALTDQIRYAVEYAVGAAYLISVGSSRQTAGKKMDQPASEMDALTERFFVLSLLDVEEKIDHESTLPLPEASSHLLEHPPVGPANDPDPIASRPKPAKRKVL